MTEQNVILVGAVFIRESVIEPFQKTEWLIHGWDGVSPIIFADDRAIMVFDCNAEGAGVLHVIIEDSYSAQPITQISWQGCRARLVIELDIEAQVEAGLYDLPPGQQIWERLIRITASHLRTQQRIFLLAEKILRKDR